jgi:ABC-2 type transport system ATP-binding protein
MTVAIDVQGIHKHFTSLHALKGIDLQINKGEFFGLLGPNGAGKSTLINIIAGLTRADAGTVAVVGHDVVNHYRQARQCLGIVPQELVFDAFFTVREVLQIQSGYFGLGKGNEAWIDELLEALMLSDKADANMRTLSGGMKRRVLVAQALVHKPDVVVLDEPTAGVDVELRKSLWSFVSHLHQQGHTIVLTTHYLEEAEALCDRIAILNHGEIIALDSKKNLLNSELGKSYQLSVTAVADIIIDQIPERLRNQVKKIDGHNLELELNKDQNSVVDVINALNSAGIEVIDVSTQRADLEDVFVSLIQRQLS